jgi:ferric-dicitrate binding protein FerR (iron transport regulator)
MTDPAELRDLCAAAVEGRLTGEQAARLEELVIGSADARRFYVGFVQQHAALVWSAGDPALLDRSASRLPAAPLPARPSRPVRKWAGWAVAAGVVVAGVWLAFGRAAPDSSFAQMAEVKEATWGSGTLPTAEGARLGTGRLRLAEGLARIVFDTGAELRLEGPADLELVDDRRCVLHNGRLIGKALNAGAIGFVVDTPTAELKDLGTEFGVNVRDGKADVQVFDGRVDVRHHGSGRVSKMLNGGNLRFSPDAVVPFRPDAESPAGLNLPPVPDGLRVVTLTTATGRGRDAYIQPDRTTNHQSDVHILVKSASEKTGQVIWRRKGYMAFDLSELPAGEIRDAQLTLTIAPTGMGFAAECPDATFAIYGLTDRTLGGWTESGLTWDNAPGNDRKGNGLNPAKVVRLGEFVIAQGLNVGTRGVSGPAVADFLKRNRNGTATFIVLRETLGSGRSDLVHGFANKHHPTLPPPMLKLTVEAK